MRTLHQDSLMTLGYTVDVFESGPEAIHRFRETPDVFDLVLTDLTMPNMSGFELGVAIHRIRPDIPILMVTGYNEDLTDEMKQASGIEQVLMKPCRIGDMAAAIRKALNRKE